MEQKKDENKWLEEVNQLLLKSDPNSKEFILTLKKIILEQRSLMEKFFQTIRESSPSGFEHALVLRSQKVSVTGYQEQLYGDFKMHDKVCIDPKSPFARMSEFSNESGEIIEFDPEGFKGWALVLFSPRTRKSFRYGNPEVDGGACDLMLLEKSLIGKEEKIVTTVFYRGSVVDVFDYLDLDLNEGDTVLIHPKTEVIIGKTESIESGKVGYVEEVLESQAIISLDGAKQAVILPKNIICSQGDRVIVDNGLHVVLLVLPKTKSVAIVSDIDPVKWDDVIGLKEAKDEAMEVVNFVLYPEVYHAYHAKEPKGILLIGPPGTGKTHFGKALATMLSERLGTTDGTIKGFMYIKATEILDMYVGEAPRKVREIFAKAKEYYLLTGQKVIIFLDEADAVLKTRGGQKNNDSSDAITNAFLTEMDGIQKSYGFVIGATNRVDIIDAAAMRPGRFDRVIYVGRPKNEDVPRFFSLYLNQAILDKQITLDEIVDLSTKEYLSSDYSFYDLYYAKEGINPNDESIPKVDRLDLQHFKLSNVGSGAMIETVVNRAKFKAINRDLLSETKAPSGINFDDIKESVAEAFETSKLINLEEAIQEYIKQKKDEPVEIVSRI